MKQRLSDSSDQPGSVSTAGGGQRESLVGPGPNRTIEGAVGRCRARLGGRGRHEHSRQRAPVSEIATSAL